VGPDLSSSRFHRILLHSPHRPTDRTVPRRHMSIRRLKHILRGVSFALGRNASFMSPRCCEDLFSLASSRIVYTQFSSVSSLRHVPAHHAIQQHKRGCPACPALASPRKTPCSPRNMSMAVLQALALRRVSGLSYRCRLEYVVVF
jgi:hypothetical protein